MNLLDGFERPLSCRVNQAVFHFLAFFRVRIIPGALNFDICFRLLSVFYFWSVASHSNLMFFD